MSEEDFSNWVNEIKMRDRCTMTTVMLMFNNYLTLARLLKQAGRQAAGWLAGGEPYKYSYSIFT